VRTGLGVDIVSECSGDLLMQTCLALQIARTFENQPATSAAPSRALG